MRNFCAIFNPALIAVAMTSSQVISHLEAGKISFSMCSHVFAKFCSKNEEK